MGEAQRTPRCLNDYVIPPPGSLVMTVGQSSSDRSTYTVYTVVSAREQLYPSNWRQYFLTLVGRERLIELDVECTDFHHHWHVLLRPGFP